MTEQLESVWENIARNAISKQPLTSVPSQYVIKPNDADVNLVISCCNCLKKRSSMDQEKFLTSDIPQCGHSYCKRCLDTILLLR